MRKLLLAVAVVLSLSPAGSAQIIAGTGAYPFASFDNRGFDSVNIGNLNTRFNIPIVSKAGRGLPFNYSIQNEGLIWTPFYNATTQTTSWVPDPSWGFTGLLNGTAFTGYLVHNQYSRSCGTPTGNRSSSPSQYYLNGYAYHDPFGAVHTFTYTVFGPCSDGSSSYHTTGSPTASDSSGYTLVNGGNSLQTKTGIVITPATSAAASGGSTTETDSNGNTITFNGTSAFQDTTGSTALTITGSSPVFFQYNVTAQANAATLATVKISYKPYTVRTYFQCATVGDFGSQQVNLVDHIVLADGSTYSFTYEGTRLATDGAVTARIASITLPTGGVITYSRYGGTNAINCPDGSVPGMTRTTSDGTRNYQRAGVGTNASTTLITDEKNNQSLYHFSTDSLGNYEETHRQIYQGNDTNGTLLQEVVTCFNGSSGSCDGQAITPPITEADTATSYNGGSQAVLKSSYDTFGNLLNSAAYSGTTLLEQTATTYNGNSEVLSSKMTDGSGNTLALTTYGYDETTPTATSGLPQHGAASGTLRGNQTSSNVSTDGTTTHMLTTTTAYYDTGMPVSTIAPGGFKTSYGYDSTQTFATSTTLPSPSSGVTLATSATYDAASGAMLTSTGMNSGQTTTATNYDARLRPTLVTYPVAPTGTGTTTTTYTPNQVTVQSTVDASHSTKQVTGYDSYGRQSRTAIWNGSIYYITDTCYDATGAVQSVGAPYTSTTLPSNQSCGSGDSYTYDALGRVLSVSHGDGSSSAWTYTNRAAQQADSTGVTRIQQSDLLGRLIGVCEISPNAGSPSSCGMDVSGNGFVTSYSYDTAHLTTTVTQGVQTRKFTSDTAGRVISIQEPERGLTGYGYAYNATGLAVTRTRAKANQTNPSVTTQTVTQYDSVGRPVRVTYSDGTPTRNFYYDQSAPCCTLASMGSSIGQLTTFNNGSHSRSYAYDITGRPSQFVECLPDQCSQPSDFVWRSFTYDNVGELLTDQYATVGGNASPATITYSYNLAGQLASVSGGQNDSTLTPKIYTALSFSPYGATSTQLGNQLFSNRQYDTVGNVSGTWLCNGSSQVSCSGGTQLYGSTRHTVGGQLLNSNDSATIRNSNFSYDEFGRLKSVAPADSGNYFTSSPAYDRYGNLTAENNANGPYAIRNPSWTVDPTTNHISGYNYDAAGNRLNDVAHTYTYDAEGNMIAVDGGSTATFVYDALNERVKVTASGVTERYGYDLSGRRSTTWLDGTNTLKLTQYYAGTTQVGYWLASDTHIHFEQQDGLGTERYRTTNTGGQDGYYNDLPWGDYLGWPGNNSNTLHFALLDHDIDSGSGIEHAKFREYSANEGRWFSPDPYDGSYDYRNPQSLNRYSYVLNNPLSLRDPTGEFCEYGDDAGEGNLEEIDYISSVGECASTGGSWSPDGWGSVGGYIGYGPSSYGGFGPGGVQTSYGGGGNGGNGSALSNKPGATKPASNNPCNLSAGKRAYMFGSGLLNLASAGFKLAAAGSAELGSGGLGTPLALYGAYSAAGNITTGLIQTVGAFVPNAGAWQQAATVSSAAGSGFGLATLVATSGNVNAAASAARWEGFALLGVRGGAGSPPDPSTPSGAVSTGSTLNSAYRQATAGGSSGCHS